MPPIQLSTAVVNAALDSIETTIGASAMLRMFSGSIPADCAAADSGTKLVEMILPSDFYADASARSKALSGSWASTGLAGAAAGTAIGYYRIYNNAGSTCHEQGTVTATGGGGDMTVNNVNIADGQAISITSKTLNGGNA